MVPHRIVRRPLGIASSYEYQSRQVLIVIQTLLSYYECCLMAMKLI
jgi:hypothetical protein